MPTLRKLRPLFRFVLRSLALGVTLLCVYFGTTATAYYSNLHALDAASIRTHPLPAFPAPISTTRLMVFAPHCDDETLGNAGLIQRTVIAGGTVQTVLFTNGDGFPAGVQHEMHRLKVSSSDYVKFGAIRQTESESALQSLGVTEKTIFLGYPDQGLLAMWNGYWNSETPFTSAFTGKTKSPYTNCFHPGVIYCGQNVLEDVKRALRQFRPTLVTVTHPEEDHSDHAAAGAFVTLALTELREEPDSADWAKRCELRYYLVHRGNWPPANDNVAIDSVQNAVQKRQKSFPILAPPAAIRGQDTEWRSLAMTSEQGQRKVEAVARYASQTVMMGRYLSGFLKANEIFGAMYPASVVAVPDDSLKTDGEIGDWRNIPPALLDPANDNLARSMQGGADVLAVYMAHDNHNLYLRVNTRTEISSRATFYFLLRPFGERIGGREDSSASAFGFAVQGGTISPALDAKATLHGRTLEIALPLSRLTALLKGGKIKRLAFSLDTSVAGLGIDRTGIRILEMPQ